MNGAIPKDSSCCPKRDLRGKSDSGGPKCSMVRPPGEGEGGGGDSLKRAQSKVKVHVGVTSPEDGCLRGGIGEGFSPEDRGRG